MIRTPQEPLLQGGAFALGIGGVPLVKPLAGLMQNKPDALLCRLIEVEIVFVENVDDTFIGSHGLPPVRASDLTLLHTMLGALCRPLITVFRAGMCEVLHTAQKRRLGCAPRHPVRSFAG